ncbi:MAG: hypothetical protein IT292_02230 [Deltaproteobacteria bacterium]|nr:hypothetical protein [Deltaproteobacteria bacterium]
MALSVDEAWNSVALEERIELISRAQANGVLAAICFILVAGSLGYGWDQIWLLWGGVIASFLVLPLFTSRSWRKRKPVVILSYLAARSVARRYAYGYGIRDLDIILIFRGTMEEQYTSEEDKAFARKDETFDFETGYQDKRDVWICLLRGGIVAISERMGGAKLEYTTMLDKDTQCEVHEAKDINDTTIVTVKGSGKAKGRQVVFTSNYPGALYVFHRQLARLIVEATLLANKLAELAKNASI